MTLLQKVFPKNSLDDTKILLKASFPLVSIFLYLFNWNWNIEKKLKIKSKVYDQFESCDSFYDQSCFLRPYRNSRTWCCFFGNHSKIYVCKFFNWKIHFIICFLLLKGITSHSDNYCSWICISMWDFISANIRR